MTNITTESNHTSPSPVTVAKALPAKAMVSPSATGTSIVRCRLRSATAAPVKKARPGHASTGTVSIIASHRKSCSNPASMPPYHSLA